ncbi:MAG: molybdenum cofactor biosynthesis protein MoaE [Verrucomicrobiota bacterium]
MRQLIVLQEGAIVVPSLDLNSTETGAVADFLGIVREMEGPVRLSGLRYEAYEPMARKQLERIFKELGVLYPAFAVTFIHRIGWVPVGGVSLFMRVQTIHRGDAFEFMAAAINRLKRDVPVWKRA